MTSPIEILIHPVRYWLTKPIETGATIHIDRAGAIVEIRAEGLTGWGEGLPIPGWPNGDPSFMMRALYGWADRIRAQAFTATDVIGALVDADLPKHAVAAAAADCARLDLLAQRNNTSLAAVIGAPQPKGHSDEVRHRPIRSSVPVNALVSGRTTTEIVESARASLARGIGTFKMKVGVLDIGLEAERVGAVRDEIGPDASIRLDANGAWRLQEAETSIDRLAAFDIEYIEEPVATLGELSRLAKTSPIPVYADEQISDPMSARQVVASGLTAGIVLKPAVLGSLVATRHLAEQAARAGLGVTITNALDSGVGTTAAMHVAASIDADVNACGLATGELFSVTPAEMPAIASGSVGIPERPGLGVTPVVSSEIGADDLAQGRAG